MYKEITTRLLIVVSALLLSACGPDCNTVASIQAEFAEFATLEVERSKIVASLDETITRNEMVGRSIDKIADARANVPGALATCEGNYRMALQLIRRNESAVSRIEGINERIVVYNDLISDLNSCGVPVNNPQLEIVAFEVEGDFFNEEAYLADGCPKNFKDMD